MQFSFSANFCLSSVHFIAPIQVAESKDTDVKKVLILGSGGLSIGQAGEFDYSGSQVNFVDRKAIHLSYLYHPCIVCRR